MSEVYLVLLKNNKLLKSPKDLTNWFYKNRHEISTERSIKITVYTEVLGIKDDYTGISEVTYNETDLLSVYIENISKQEWEKNTNSKLEIDDRLFIIDYIDDKTDTDYIDYNTIKKIKIKETNMNEDIYKVVKMRFIGIKRKNKVYFYVRKI